MAVSVIMPVYNGVEFITLSLPPLIAMRDRGEVLEVIVVDDGSTDATCDTARQLGATVTSSGGRIGPGGARNKAAETAAGDILWFVDADVVVHADAATALLAGFADPDVVAVFGSYDTNPPAKNFFSQYKNLVHHYYHQRASEEASTFWSGCGAVRRDDFLAVRGFDVERYKYPSVEDIELGHRLIKAGGRVRLLRNFQCTHLKVWRFGNLIHTEIFRRAIPWARLIISSGDGIPNDLNVGMAEQLRAIMAGVLLLSVLALLAGVIGPATFLLTCAVALYVNRQIAGFFYSHGGFIFAFGALLFHQVYYLYSASAFSWVVIEHFLAGLFSRRLRSS